MWGNEAMIAAIGHNIKTTAVMQPGARTFMPCSHTDQPDLREPSGFLCHTIVRMLCGHLTSVVDKTVKVP